MSLLLRPFSRLTAGLFGSDLAPRSILRNSSKNLCRLQSVLSQKCDIHTSPLKEMRFVQFRLEGDPKRIARVGFQKENGKLVDLSGSLLPTCRSLVEALQDLGPDKVKEIAGASSSLAEVGDHELLSPITSPDKLICIGMNYHDHCAELGAPTPVEPVVFSKFPSSIVGPTDNIPFPDVTKELDWEVELTVVIGKGGKDIEISNAKDHIFGYTVAHDVSARDWQLKRNGGQWLLGKTMDGFCPMGPCIVTADEIGDPHNLSLSCRVNGQTKQNSTTAQLVHNVYACIAWLSKFVTLTPGDVILTGTPPGVGCFAKPPQFLQRGDVVECEVEKIGIIRNQVV